MARDFWSRRRAAVQAEAEAEVLESQRLTEAQEAEERAKREAEKTDEELLAELGLPDPDSMEQGDDFSAFMSKAVPQRLRTRALRKLWVSNPLLANLDGMVDYADDFRDSAVVIPDLKTAYQVGKGMMAHVQKLAAEAEALAGAREMPEEVANTDEAPVEEAVSADASENEQPATPAETPNTTPDDTQDDDAQPMPRRHMRFVFADSH
jgi:hypothetical protein